MSIEQMSPRDHRGTWGPSHPAVTEALLPEGWKPGCAELEDLWYQIVKELTHREYRNRTHGSRRTAEAGCSGPMCKKAVREHSRRRVQGQPSEKYKYVDKLIEYFSAEATQQLELWDREVRRAMSRKFA